MSAGVCRVGDTSLLENVGCVLPATAIIVGSPTVFAEGLAVAFIGSNLFSHSCTDGTKKISHTFRTISQGSPTVFVNGQAVAYIGCKITAIASPPDIPCTDMMAKGSATVFVATPSPPTPTTIISGGGEGGGGLA